MPVSTGGKSARPAKPAARMAAKEPVAATDLGIADRVPNSGEFDKKWRFLS
jgi:hypothetical protein